MLWGDGFVIALIVQYLVVSLVYALQTSWYKALYFISAAGIGVAVLKMR